MLYLLIFTYMLVLPVTILALLITILSKVEDVKVSLKKEIQYELQNPKEEIKQQVRKHLPIGQSDYDNVFGGRKAYEIYKNKDGLYEPITPSRGIPIKELKPKEE